LVGTFGAGTSPRVFSVDHVTGFGPFVLVTTLLVKGVGDVKVAEQAQMSTYGSRSGRDGFQLPASRTTGMLRAFASFAACRARVGWWPSSRRAFALVRSTVGGAFMPCALWEITVRSPSLVLTDTALTVGGSVRVGSASFSSTPCLDKSSAAKRASGCVPSTVHRWVRAPRATIATAALVAGPPAAVSTDRDCTFSPGAGSDSTRCTRSTVHSPTATTSVTGSVRWFARPPRSSRRPPTAVRRSVGLPPRSSSGFSARPPPLFGPGGGRGPGRRSRRRGACCG
jgi:hypothetical protein